MALISTPVNWQLLSGQSAAATLLAHLLFCSSASATRLPLLLLLVLVLVVDILWLVGF